MAWTISFIKERCVRASETFYPKWPTCRAPTSEKELGFYTVQFKPSGHNAAGWKVFERRVIFRKETISALGALRGALSFSSSRQASSSCRLRAERFAPLRGWKVDTSGSVNSAQIHTGHCAAPQKSNTALGFRRRTDQTSFSGGKKGFSGGNLSSNDLQ